MKILSNERYLSIILDSATKYNLLPREPSRLYTRPIFLGVTCVSVVFCLIMYHLGLFKIKDVVIISFTLSAVAFGMTLPSNPMLSPIARLINSRDYRMTKSAILSDELLDLVLFTWINEPELISYEGGYSERRLAIKGKVIYSDINYIEFVKDVVFRISRSCETGGADARYGELVELLYQHQIEKSLNSLSKEE